MASPAADLRSLVAPSGDADSWAVRAFAQKVLRWSWGDVRVTTAEVFAVLSEPGLATAGGVLTALVAESELTVCSLDDVGYVLDAALDDAWDSDEHPAPANDAAPRDLWALIGDTFRPVEERVEALMELVDDGDPILPAYLADALEQRDQTPAWLDALIDAVEHVQVVDAALRGRVVVSLLEHARQLRDEGGHAPLWSAVRRYASMVPVEASDSLLEFLRPEDAVTTQQVALQGVFHIFSVERAAGGVARDRLRERVHALAVEKIDPAKVQGSEDAALCFCCFEAAMALGDPELDDVLARLERLGRRRLTERAKTRLAEFSNPQSRMGAT